VCSSDLMCFPLFHGFRELNGTHVDAGS
jgi:hypothetical protein